MVERKIERMVERLMPPRRVLMLKSHSLGVGDLLRSSVAWRVMKDAWPGVELHLLFLSKHPGYPTQDLIASHHLLTSAHFITLREGSPQNPSAQRVPVSQLLHQAFTICVEHDIDWIIDFEMHGLRTAWLTWRLQRFLTQRQTPPQRHAIQTLGVNQFWPRAWFYTHCSVSLPAFMKKQGLMSPMDYAERDLVVLSALGLERQATPIELEAPAPAKAHAQGLLSRALPDQPPSPKRALWGLNIGCGTPDALGKRPAVSDLVQAMVLLAREHTFDLVLTGAPFEREVNEAFIDAFHQALDAQAGRLNTPPRLFNAAGTGNLTQLSGLIAACGLFISTDSGPYHMAVALKVPTLAWFVIDQPASYHAVSWCVRVLNPSPQAVLAAANEVLSHQEGLRAAQPEPSQTL